MGQLKLRRWCLYSLGLLLSPGAAIAQTPDASNPLRTALCLNDWNRAIVLMGPMIAATDITSARRQTLVDYRQRLIDLRDEQVVLEDLPGCDQILSQYLAELPERPTPPLDWEDAIAATYGIGTTVPELSSQELRQQEASYAARLIFAQENEIESLSPFNPLDTTSIGSAVSTGAVSSGYEVYSFLGGQGDVITIQVDVTEVYASLYTDDDSQLFLFDSQGTLIADNDDFTGLQSAIANFALPSTDRYYVAVTTYNNDPLLDGDRRITDWSGSGGSDIDFTISVTGLTPTNQLVLPK